MRLSRTVAYAVKALVSLHGSQHAAPVPCARIAQQGRMPERYLLQILRDLVRAGILQSVRGVEGGYRLACDPDAITLEDIVAAVEGPIVTKAPPLEAMEETPRRRLMLVFDGIAADARGELAQIRLSDLIEDGTANPDAPAHRQEDS